MALLRQGLAPPTGMESKHLFPHSGGGLAVPRHHPGKYVVASSPDASSDEEDELEGASPGGADPTETPFAMAGHLDTADTRARHAAAAASHHHNNHHSYGGGGVAGPGGGGSVHGRGEGAGEQEQRSRWELIREQPYPHRWPSRKRRKCRSLGHLALHAPTIDEEQPAVRPSSVSPPGASAAAPQQAAAAAAAAAPPPLPRSAPQQPPAQQAQHAPLQQPSPVPPRQPPAPAAAPPPQRVSSLPPAGAPRAMRQSLQAAAVGKPAARAPAAGAKRARPSSAAAGSSGAGPPPVPGASRAAGGGPPPGVRQLGKPATSKPPGKPPFKPSPSPQAQPVRRPSAVTLDRQRSGSLAAGGAAAGGAAAPRPQAAPGAPAAMAPPMGGYHASMGVPGHLNDFGPGQLVWAKMPSYPWWPAQVQSPQPNHLNIKHGSTDVFVVFYGTADFNWVPRKDVKPFSHTLPDYSKLAGLRNKGLQRAIDEAWVALGRPRPDVNGKPHD